MVDVENSIANRGRVGKSLSQIVVLTISCAVRVAVFAQKSKDFFSMMALGVEVESAVHQNIAGEEEERRASRDDGARARHYMKQSFDAARSKEVLKRAVRLEGDSTIHLHFLERPLIGA